MRILNIDARLKAAADFVSSGSIVADIGTDHAYLPCWLIQNGISKKAYACDINTGPLSKAKDTVIACGLSDKVELILCDGLSGAVPYKDEITDIIIAGMGGELIVRILSEANWIKDEKFNFVFQPMTKEHILRRYLCENGWYIKDETAALSSNKHYTVIDSRFDGVERSCDMLYMYSGNLLNKNDSAALGYKKMIANKLKKAGLGRINNPQSAELAKEYLECAARLSGEE